MSGLLNNIRSAFDTRMALRRRMLDHLGLDLTEAEAARLRDDLHETILRCTACADPACCNDWLDERRSGLPPCCAARDAFLRLDAATTAARRTADLAQVA